MLRPPAELTELLWEPEGPYWYSSKVVGFRGITVVSYAEIPQFLHTSREFLPRSPQVKQYSSGPTKRNGLKEKKGRQEIGSRLWAGHDSLSFHSLSVTPLAGGKGPVDMSEKHRPMHANHAG
jgi:hypothetical protein